MTVASLALTMPEAINQQLLWAEVMMAWTIGVYTYGSYGEGKRWAVLSSGAALTGLTPLVLVGLNAWPLAGVLAFLTAVLMGIRSESPLSVHKIYKKYAAPIEVAIAVAAVVLSGAIIAGGGYEIKRSLLALDVGPDKLAAMVWTLSVLVFSVRGGTVIVRGVLEKAQVLPQTQAPPAGGGTDRGTDEEYNRGRVIGNLERILLILTVLVGSYEALGLIIAAKGLIRGREMEDRDRAEYFIIGSLMSVLVAVIAGLALKGILSWLSVSIDL